jgi:hypothetical protein
MEFTPDYDPATLWVPGTIGFVILIGGVAIREGHELPSNSLVVIGWIIVGLGCVLALKYVRLKMKLDRSSEEE